MADVFDTLTEEQPQADVFDAVAEAPVGDIFDSLAEPEPVSTTPATDQALAQTAAIGESKAVQAIFEQADAQREIELNAGANAPQWAQNAAAGAVETAKGLVPQSLGEVLPWAAGAVTPIPAAIHSVTQGAGAIKDWIDGKPLEQINAERFPESQILLQAEQTPAGSKERFAAGFNVLAQMAMGAGIVHGMARASNAPSPKSDLAGGVPEFSTLSEKNTGAKADIAIPKTDDLGRSFPESKPVPEGMQAPVESVLPEEARISNEQPQVEQQVPKGGDFFPPAVEKVSSELNPESTIPDPVTETGKAQPVATSVKNAQVDIERATRGLPPAMEEAARDFGTVWDEAAKRADADPTYADRLVAELKENPRSVQDTENAVLLRRQIELQNEFDKAADDLIVANETRDSAGITDADARLASISDNLVTLYDIDKTVGRTTARGLNARKMLANEDFSLAKMVTRKRVAKGGAPLTPAEATAVREQSRQISTLEKQLNEAELQTHFRELLSASAEEARQVKASKRGGIVDFLDEQANKARERIRARGGRLTTGLDPIDLADHAIIGASYLAKGVKGFSQWSAEMIRDFGETVKPFLKDLYARAKEFHTANAKVFVTPDDRRLLAAKKRTATRIEDLQGKIESGNFTKPERKQPVTDKELEDLRYKLFRVKDEFSKGVFEDQMKRRTKTEKFGSGVREVVNLSRAMLTSWDFPPIFRQGGFITWGAPGRTIANLPETFRAIFSPQEQFRINEGIANRPNGRLYHRDKLALTEVGGTRLNKMEENFMSRWLDKIPAWTGAGPVMRASGRGYTTLLNLLRADTYDVMVADMTRTGVPTTVEGRVIAQTVNDWTGRSSFGKFEKSAIHLNTLFFAPRLQVSRFRTLLGANLRGGTARTRKLIIKQYAKTLSGIATFYGLGIAAGGKVEADPRSSDFGKLRFGNTRLDPLFGLSQATVFLTRLATGETKTTDGKVRPLREGLRPINLFRKIPDRQKVGKQDMLGTIINFGRSKLAPVPGASINAITGEDVVGRPVTPGDAALSLAVPINAEDLVKAMEERGVPQGAALDMMALWGMGLATYQANSPKEKMSLIETIKDWRRRYVQGLPSEQKIKVKSSKKKPTFSTQL